MNRMVMKGPSVYYASATGWLTSVSRQFVLVIRLLDRRHQIVEFLDPQHANVANGARTPRQYACDIDRRQHASDGVDFGAAETHAAWLPCETVFLQHFANFQVGVVVRVAVMLPK